MKKSFWDILAWIAFAYVVLYALLKVAGILHSPLPLDAAAIASTAYFVGKYAQRIDFSIKETDFVKNDLKGLKMEFSGLKVELGELKSAMTLMKHELKSDIAALGRGFHSR